MGKHSASKPKLRASAADFFQGLVSQRQGRHSDIDEEPRSAAGVLRATKRMPNWAAIAVPAAAVASLAVSGVMLAPGDTGSTQRVVFSGEDQPHTGPAFDTQASAGDAKADEVRKNWDDAVAKSKKHGQAAAIQAAAEPAETPDAKSSAAAGDRGEKSSRSAAKEPKQNSKASGTGGTCKASFYGEGQKTATGENFNPSALTAAHKTLPFNSHVKVTNKANGKSVVVRINDRGPFVSGRCLDLSTAAMKAVGGTGSGVITVDWQVQ